MAAVHAVQIHIRIHIQIHMQSVIQASNSLKGWGVSTKRMCREYKLALAAN